MSSLLLFILVPFPAAKIIAYFSIMETPYFMVLVTLTM